MFNTFENKMSLYLTMSLVLRIQALYYMKLHYSQMRTVLLSAQTIVFLAEKNQQISVKLEINSALSTSGFK